MTNTKKSNGRNVSKGRRTKSADPISPSMQIIKVGIRSVVLSMSAAFLLMLIAAAIAFNSADPGAAVVPISLGALYVSAVFCGFLSKRSSNSSSLLSGAVSGLMFILTVLLVSLFLGSGSQGFSSGTKAILLLLTLPAVFLGAILGSVKIIKKRKKPYNKKR